MLIWHSTAGWLKLRYGKEGSGVGFSGLLPKQQIP
jgi:hypothetical protein